MFLMAVLFSPGSWWEMLFFCLQCFLHRHRQNLKSIFSHFCFSPHSFLASFCCHVCMSLYRSTKQSTVFYSGAEFTLSSLTSLVVIICCHFSLLWERYVHLFWKVFQALTFGIFCCLYKAFELMSLQWNVVVFYPHAALCFINLKHNRNVFCTCGWQESQTKYNSTVSHYNTLKAGIRHLQ